MQGTPDNIEGSGEGSAPDSLLVPGHEREGLRMLRQAIRKGWSIPDVWKDTLPVEVHKLLETTDDERTKIRAIEAIMAMEKANTDKLVALDKIERLDTGGATEVVQFKPMAF